MSLTLAMNAAEGRIQFTVSRGETLLIAQEWHTSANGVELLAPALAQAFRLAGLCIRDIGRIACVRGPGGFTGLRLVLATAGSLSRGILAVTGAPVMLAGLNYLELLAAGPALSRHATLWTLTHARRDLVHAQGFRISPDQHPLSFTDVFAADLRETVRIMAGHSKAEFAGTGHACACSEAALPVYALGSGLMRNYAVFIALWKEAGAEVMPLPACFSQVSCGVLADFAERACYADEDITPLYVRLSDAEEQLPAIARRLGVDPEESLRRLAQALNRA